MGLTPSDLQAIGLTLQVAALTTFILLILGVPLAWWLARSRSPWRKPVEALVAMPLVLPPSVIGFYLLVLMGPQGAVGQWTQALGLGVLPFTFAGLVVGSVVYSLPFMVQPVLGAMQSLGDRPLEVAATLRAAPLDRFVHVVLPLCKPGLITGTIDRAASQINGGVYTVSYTVSDGASWSGASIRVVRQTGADQPPTASFVCKVLSTRCPVSAPRIAISVVSRSRISPTMITSGSPVRILLKPLANVSLISGFTAI